ncbi:MAG: acyl-CoA thioesterase [Burkholderiales bacterium]|nr:acyl-CoA thioesterase [Burkholderiales bacterium]
MINRSPDTPPIHVESMRLRWGEMDALRHLNNVAYFRYFEEARIHWFATLGIDYGDEGEGPILANIETRFVKPALYPEDVVIELRIGKVGNSSFVLAHTMRSAGDPSVVYSMGEAVLVWIDIASGKSKPLPARIREILQLPR